MAINDRIDKLRLSATRSLLERRDVIIVASVSCIYALGSPEYYQGMNLILQRGQEMRRDDILFASLKCSTNAMTMIFYVPLSCQGDVIDIFPAYEEDLALRIEFFGDEIEQLSEIDPLTGKSMRRIRAITLYPGSHHVTPEEVRWSAIETIREELEERHAIFENEKKLLERERIHESNNA